VLQELGDYHGARQQYEEALRIAQANKEQGFEFAAGTASSAPYCAPRRPTTAKGEHERALEIGQATLSPDHYYVATFRRNLDTVMQQLGR
jgi:hypothetical protein